MAWPSAGNFATDHLDAGTDDPSQARADLLAALTDLADIIGARGIADGIASLDGSALIPTSELPVVPISKGGTGATSAATALTALGAQAALGYTPARTTGVVTFTGTVEVENTASAHLDVTYTGSDGWGGVLNLGTSLDPPVAGQYVGTINFGGYNSIGMPIQYGMIETIVIDPNIPTDRGALYFQVRHDGAYSNNLLIQEDYVDLISGTGLATAGTLKVGGTTVIDSSRNGIFTALTASGAISGASLGLSGAITVGTGGPLIKNSTTSILFRNNADSANASIFCATANASAVSSSGNINTTAGVFQINGVDAISTARRGLFSGATMDYDLKFTNYAAPTAPTVAAGGAGAVTAGTHYYRITFLTANGETELGTASVINIDGSHAINLSNIPTGPAGVIYRKIYRTKAGGTAYFEVNQISDNTTTTFVDNVIDGSLGATDNTNRPNNTGGVILNNATPAAFISANGLGTYFGFDINVGRTASSKGIKVIDSYANAWFAALTLTGNIQGTGTGYTYYQVSQGDYHHHFYSRTNAGAASERFRIEGGAATGEVYFLNCNMNLPGVLKTTGIPTSDPHVAGQIWADSTVLKVSAG